MPYKDIEQQRQYQREWMAARRKSWLQANGPCIDCGSWDDLEVDHVDASSKVSHRVWSWSEERRGAELAKCVARCNSCHKKKSSAEHAKGEARYWNVKLTEVQALEIKASEEPDRVLSERYGVHRVTIFKIRSGLTWKHLNVAPSSSQA